MCVSVYILVSDAVSIRSLIGAITILVIVTTSDRYTNRLQGIRNGNLPIFHKSYFLCFIYKGIPLNLESAQNFVIVKGALLLNKYKSAGEMNFYDGWVILNLNLQSTMPLNQFIYFYN